jgi:hypothetical protein
MSSLLFFYLLFFSISFVFCSSSSSSSSFTYCSDSRSQFFLSSAILAYRLKSPVVEFSELPNLSSGHEIKQALFRGELDDIALSTGLKSSNSITSSYSIHLFYFLLLPHLIDLQPILSYFFFFQL